MRSQGELCCLRFKRLKMSVAIGHITPSCRISGSACHKLLLLLLVPPPPPPPPRPPARAQQNSSYWEPPPVCKGYDSAVSWMALGDPCRVNGVPPGGDGRPRHGFHSRMDAFNPQSLCRPNTPLAIRARQFSATRLSLGLGMGRQALEDRQGRIGGGLQTPLLPAAPGAQCAPSPRIERAAPTRPREQSEARKRTTESGRGRAKETWPRRRRDPTGTPGTAAAAVKVFQNVTRRLCLCDPDTSFAYRTSSSAALPSHSRVGCTEYGATQPGQRSCASHGGRHAGKPCPPAHTPP